MSNLEEITGGDRSMILEMLDLFIRDIPVHISKIDAHAQANEIDEIGKEAHKFKPTLQYIGLIDMFEDIKQLEMIAKSNENLEAIDDIVKRLKDGIAVCMPALVAKRDELS